MTVLPSTRDYRRDAGAEDPRSTGIGGWAIVAVLLLLLVGAGAIGYFGWTISNTDVPTAGYVAMALGAILSLVFGVGLMALVFYSSRKGFDEPATLIHESGEADEPETRLQQRG